MVFKAGMAFGPIDVEGWGFHTSHSSIQCARLGVVLWVLIRSQSEEYAGGAGCALVHCMGLVVGNHRRTNNSS